MFIIYLCNNPRSTVLLFYCFVSYGVTNLNCNVQDYYYYKTDKLDVLVSIIIELNVIWMVNG